MPFYKLIKDKFHIGEDGERLKLGDTIEMSGERFKNANLKDRFEMVAGSDDEEEESTTTISGKNSSMPVSTPIDSKFSAITGMSVEEVVNLIESLETEEDLELLRKEELSNKRRKGVISAIDAALEE